MPCNSIVIQLIVRPLCSGACVHQLLLWTDIIGMQTYSGPNLGDTSAAHKAMTNQSIPNPDLGECHTLQCILEGIPGAR